MIAIRPENIKIGRNGFPPDLQNTFEGTVTRILNQGFYCDVRVEIQDISFRGLMLSRSLTGMNLSKGDPVSIGFRAEDVHAF